MSKLVSIGELIVDFQSEGHGSLKNTNVFKKSAGGAPANVCAQASLLGVKTLYLSSVGDDGFGDFLIEALNEVNIDTTYIKKNKSYDTSLAFVSHKENGEREFSFFRKACADLNFTPADFENVEINQGDILEFGSVALASYNAKETHKSLIKKAKKNNAVIAFDPNLRFNLWQDQALLLSTVNEFIDLCDILKVSDEEIEFITGLKSRTSQIQYFFNKGVKLVLFTKGSHGAELYYNDKCYTHPGYKVNAIDTTGAGDSFFGAFLAAFLKLNADFSVIDDKANELLDIACKCGAITTTGYGAIASMPSLKEIR